MMSNGYKLELLPKSDGGYWLSFGDSMHGDDVVFEIEANGVVKRTLAGETEGEDVTVYVNLPRELLALGDRLYGGGQ
jgi:hypothetical protein